MRTKQCGYHFGTPMACRMIQLSHGPGKGEWQEPIWACGPCRKYLRGSFRYYKIDLEEKSEEEIEQALDFFGLR